jgi:lipopolysaccharide transport system ATP-binding protein
MPDVAITIENVGKAYTIGLEDKKSDTLFGAVTKALSAPFRNFRNVKNLSNFKGKDRKDVVYALRDVSFNISQGEAVAIIGHNGAGKSTLLKIIARITDPTLGKIKIFGRVSSLLEVGTGFHPDLTGRENVFLNGTILGMRKDEIERKFDEIVEFAGIGQYIDTPVKRYSSGMRVRLAFSVAAHLEAEILLIDEVLAVGDVQFQKKCLNKMNEITGQGRTVLFVSHNLGAVKELCTRGIVLNKGRLEFDGNIKESIIHYLEAYKSGSNTLENITAQSTSVVIGDLLLNGSLDLKVEPGTPIKVSLPFKADKVNNPRVKFLIEDFMGNYVVYLDLHSEKFGHKQLDGSNILEIQLPSLWLSPGVYSTHFRIFTDTQNRLLSNKTFFEVIGNEDIVSSGFFSGGAEKSTALAPRVIWNVEKINE